MQPDNQVFEEPMAYDKDNLLKPSKMVVHTGQNPTLFYNNGKDKDYYSFILNGTKDVIRDWLYNYENYSLTRLPKEELQEIRKGKAVELIFDYPMDLANIRGMLDIAKNPWSDIKDVRSIIVAPYENRLFIIDESKESLYQFTSIQMSTVLKGVITEIEKRNDYSSVFLNIFNDETYGLYGDYAIAPVVVSTMPALKVKSEITEGTEISTEVIEFFNEKSNISSFKDADGKATYTDREEETVTVDKQGVLEYYKYNVAPDNIKYTEVKEAIDIATQFINKHKFGFTYDFYLSGVESINQGGGTSYIISFDYKYNGVPIITKLDTGSSAIEVEIVGQEVKRYKRNVRVIEDQGETINIKNFVDITNIIWGYIDTQLNEKESASIVILNDIYLAYIERKAALVPVWVVDVKVEGKDNKLYDKKYIIGAEEGEIGLILDEQ
jgi:hypothetical protein